MVASLNRQNGPAQLTKTPRATVCVRIDIEPDRADQQLTNIVLRDLILDGNVCAGFLIGPGHFNSSTKNISIDVTNMTVNGTEGVGIGIGSMVGVGGHVRISRSRVVDTKGCGFATYGKAATAAFVTLSEMSFSRVALGTNRSGRSGCAPQGPCSPLIVMGNWDPPFTVDVGGFSVGGTIEDRFDRPFLLATDPGHKLVDATFQLNLASSTCCKGKCKSEVQKNQSEVEVTAKCRMKTDDSAPTCTLPHGSCCGNATWSTFKWRAKASPNVQFSPAGADTTATGTSVQPAQPHDLFTVCLASAKLDGCTNATAANTWSGWHTFAQDAAHSLCKVYPNSDPSVVLVLNAFARGVRVGNMSTFTLEIRPGGARSHQPSYTLNATVTPIRQMEDGGTHFAPAVRLLTPSVIFMLAAENHTVQPPLITSRENNRKYYRAMPSPRLGKSPRRITILQEYDARDDDAGAHLEAATALHRQLGASALRAAGSTAALQQIMVAAGVPWVGGRLTAPCNHTRCKTDRSFPNASNEQDVEAMIRDWADSWVDMMQGTGTNMSALTQLEMYDEIGWSFPSIFAGADCVWHDCFNMSLNARTLQKFHGYIQHQGLTEPSALGATTWDEVKPLTNLTAIESGTDPKLVEAHRILFYWSVRFAAWEVESYYAKVVAAVARANKDEPVGAFLNANNFHGRLYEPLGSQVITGSLQQGPRQRRPASNSHRYKATVQHSTAGETGRGGIDWFEAGRMHTGDILFTEGECHSVVI